jgi:hypothetical protein
MATVTLGTAAQTTLVAMPYSMSAPEADFATIAQHILDDQNVAHPIYGNAAWALNGLLYVPNRGVLKVLPGDYVAYDPNGWPILVSANSIAGTGWDHS